MKRPAFQFYPADWRKDSALQSCGMAARGLWHEMLCIMHECSPYGHLSVNGQPMSTAQLSRLVGEGERDVRVWLAELELAGVFSESEDRVIYSRRMVADERIRNVRSDSGRLGGNPALLNQKDKPKVNHKVNQEVDGKDKGGSENLRKQNPTPSSSSSSSSSNQLNQGAETGGTVAGKWAVDLIALGVKATSMHPTMLKWIEEKIQFNRVLEAVGIARQYKSLPESLALNYVDRVLRNTVLVETATASKGSWRSSDATIMTKATELGVSTIGRQRDEIVRAIDQKLAEVSRGTGKQEAAA